MRHRSLFVAAGALVLAGLTAGAAAAQGQCRGAVPVNGECRIGHYHATFASATGTVSGDSVHLTGGWVFLSHRGGGGPNARDVVVTTSFLPGGVGAAPVTPGATLPSFLVIAYQNLTAVAVTSGTMGTPAGLAAGCEVQDGSTPGTPFAISTDPGAVGILNGLGVSFPSTCPQP